MFCEIIDLLQGELKFEFDGGKVNGKIVDRCRKDYD